MADKEGQKKDALAVTAEGGERVRVPKRKVALFYGYVGTAYHGNQFNAGQPDAPTVESVLLDALHRTGRISDANHRDLWKLSWGRVSRTDKGVHAARSVATFSMQWREDSEPVEQLLSRLNGALPRTVRAFDVQRVSRNFDAMKYCQFRAYEYVVPLRVLDPDGARFGGSAGEAAKALHAFLQNYVGSHVFANFTAPRELRRADAAGYARRVLRALSAAPLTLLTAPSEPRVCARVVGQSFMYNQIRMMMGLAHCALRHALDVSGHWRRVFSMEYAPVPLAPAEGLLQDAAQFLPQPNREMPPVELAEESPAALMAKEFKEGEIYRAIAEEDHVWNAYAEALDGKALQELKRFLSGETVEGAPDRSVPPAKRRREGDGDGDDGKKRGKR